VTDPTGTELAAEDPAAEDPADVEHGADFDDSADADPIDAAPAPSAGELAAALEAILFVVDTPLGLPALAAAVQQPVTEVAEALDRLRSGYDDRDAGIELREVGGGVRLYTRPRYASQVEAFLHEGQRTRLSQAALETLAVIAYRQPVTRTRISAIRGVNVDGVVRTLLSRGLIVEVGADADTGADLFRTTPLFLERMGLQTLTQLPSLAPLLPDPDSLDFDEL
jgi:segregation and condensation protein B